MKIKCKGKGCQGMAEQHEDKNYYSCYSCGWAGSRGDEQ
tara:strand:- start:15733 stop:15849 length:117 start_codon:yes stop_codon:yes gene_type:complete